MDPYLYIAQSLHEKDEGNSRRDHNVLFLSEKSFSSSEFGGLLEKIVESAPRGLEKNHFEKYLKKGLDEYGILYLGDSIGWETNIIEGENVIILNQQIELRDYLKHNYLTIREDIPLESADPAYTKPIMFIQYNPEKQVYCDRIIKYQKMKNCMEDEDHGIKKKIMDWISNFRMHFFSSSSIRN